MIAIALPDTNILRYIPQRAPIVMVHELMASEEGSTLTSFKVIEGTLFVADGVLKEPGLIENIAQTAAAGAGYQFTIHEKPVPPGFIGAIKNLKIESLPSVGQTLTTRVEVVEEVFGITLIKGEITVNAAVIASCEMKIVVQQ